MGYTYRPCLKIKTKQEQRRKKKEENKRKIRKEDERNRDKERKRDERGETGGGDGGKCVWGCQLLSLGSMSVWQLNYKDRRRLALCPIL